MTAASESLAASPAPAPPDAARVPDLAAFGAVVAPNAPRKRSVRTLHAVLGQLDPGADILEREASAIRVAAWVRDRGDVPPIEGAPEGERSQIRRLRLLVAALTAFPVYRERLSRTVQTLLREQAGLGFFANLGIPCDGGLFAETIDRLSRRLMPQPIDEQDITELVARLFPSKRDPEWIGGIPTELAMRFVGLVRRPFDLDEQATKTRASLPSRDFSLGAMNEAEERGSLPPTSPKFSAWAPLRTALLDAILLLASRVSAAGLSDAIRARSPKTPLRESPFFRLPRSIDALLATPRHDLDEASAWADECRAFVAECREASVAVLSHLEEAGVSVDVVYRLELIDRSLVRIELLIELLVPQLKHERVHAATQLLALLLHERQRDRSLSDIFGTNTRLLARKIIERAGSSGEHYITVTPREYFMMFLSAAGGGVLTAGTTTMKFLIANLHRPPLQDGLLASMNYAGSFMLMQACGFTLATKQPGMTAAALAGSVKAGGKDREALVTVVARLVRSQLAAAAGNVVMVIPAAWAVDFFLFSSRPGGHVLTPEYAHKVIASLHPTESGTILFGAITGVILWLSSLASGWLENWAVYRRLPEAIAEHRLRRVIGPRITRWAGRVFARNIAGVGGNVSVGLMLGLIPTMGQFAGIPLEVRHITLSTGSVTLAVLSLGRQALFSSELLAAVLGLAVILALNLVVSFGCAIIVALRAREVSLADAVRTFAAITIGFVRKPLRFFIPVEDPTTAAAAPGGHGH